MSDRFPSSFERLVVIGTGGVGRRGGEISCREGSSERVGDGLEEVGGVVGDDHARDGLGERKKRQ